MRERKKREGKMVIINKNIGAKLERKIHPKTINNKEAKINIGGMGMSEKNKQRIV